MYRMKNVRDLIVALSIFFIAISFYKIADKGIVIKLVTTDLGSYGNVNYDLLDGYISPNLFRYEKARQEAM